MGWRYGHVVKSWLSTLGLECANDREDMGEHIFTRCAHTMKLFSRSMLCLQYVGNLNVVFRNPMGGSVIICYYYDFVRLTMLSLSVAGSQTFFKKVSECTL